MKKYYRCYQIMEKIKGFRRRSSSAQYVHGKDSDDIASDATVSLLFNCFDAFQLWDILFRIYLFWTFPCRLNLSKSWVSHILRNCLFGRKQQQVDTRKTEKIKLLYDLFNYQWSLLIWFVDPCHPTHPQLVKLFKPLSIEAAFKKNSDLDMGW